MTYRNMTCQRLIPYMMHMIYIHLVTGIHPVVLIRWLGRSTNFLPTKLPRRQVTNNGQLPPIRLPATIHRTSMKWCVVICKLLCGLTHRMNKMMDNYYIFRVRNFGLRTYGDFVAKRPQFFIVSLAPSQRKIVIGK